MKAAIRKKYCFPKDIKVEDTPCPEPKNDGILVKVKATTVNRTDCANLTGKPLIMHMVTGFFVPRKIILGTDFAGEVVEIGQDVSRFKKGDSVFGFSDLGLSSQVEFMTIRESGPVMQIPEKIDFYQAAASIEGAHYAYSFIHKVDIKNGNRILINGATGAIGSALLQLLRPMDVHITAVCNTKNIELIKSLGANKIYDYHKEDFTLEDEKYDFVFDAVGKSTFPKCKSILKENGVYISSELGPGGQNIFYALYSLIAGKKKVIFPIPYNVKTTLPYIKEKLEDGSYNPIIDRKYTLEEVVDAYQYAISGQKTGNVILMVEKGYSPN